MTTAMRRTIVMIAATTLLVAGCSTGQGDPKVAIVVGDTNVSTVEQVQTRLNDLLATNPAAQEQAKQHKLDQVSRGIVTQQALNHLTAELAKRENITVDDEMVTRLTPLLTGEQAGASDPFQSLVDSAFPTHEVARNRLILAEIGRRAIGRTASTFDAGIVNTQEGARELAKQIAAQPDRAAALIQAAPDKVRDPVLDQQLSPESAQDLNELVQQAGSPLVALPAKTVVTYRLTGEQGGYVVLYVKSKSPARLPANADLSGLSPMQLAQVGQAQLIPLALEQAVKPNPRYGSWDSVSLKVVPVAEAAALSLVLPVNAAKP